MSWPIFQRKLSVPPLQSVHRHREGALGAVWEEAGCHVRMSSILAYIMYNCNTYMHVYMYLKCISSLDILAIITYIIYSYILVVH